LEGKDLAVVETLLTGSSLGETVDDDSLIGHDHVLMRAETRGQRWWSQLTCHTMWRWLKTLVVGDRTRNPPKRGHPRKCAFLWALVYFAGVTMYIDSQIKLCCQSAVSDPNSAGFHDAELSPNVLLQDCQTTIEQQCAAKCDPSSGTLPDVVLRRQSEARTKVEYYTCLPRSSNDRWDSIFSSQAPVLWSHTGNKAMNDLNCKNAYGQQCEHYTPPRFSCSNPRPIQANSNSPTLAAIEYRDHQIWYSLEVVEDVRLFLFLSLSLCFGPSAMAEACIVE
jgi:hypothetical protein